MKRIIFITLFLVSFLGYSQIPSRFVPEITESNLDAALITKVNSSGNSNPENVYISSESALYDSANTLKNLVIQSTITLTANRTLPLGARISGDGGVIDFNGFELIGQKSSYYNYTKKALFNVGANGTISGTWEKLPTVMSSLDFGVVNDGVDHKSDFVADKTGSGVIDISTSATTLIISDASLDASRVGQKIVVFNAGGNTSHQHALITTIASVTNATTLELTDAAVNIGSNWSLYSSGQNDLSVSGNYTGTSNKEIIVEIDSQGSPDTFRWSNDNEETWTSGVAITGSAQLLESGISITFGATTGHTGTGTVDRWKVFGFALNGTRVFYGTDNYNRIYQGLRNVREKESGKFLFSQGHYMTELIKKTELSSQQQDGLMAGNGTDAIIIDGGMSTLQAFPFDHNDADPHYYKKTDLLQLYKTRNSAIQNFRLVGSYFSDIDKNEHNIGVVASTGALDCLIKNVYTSEFSGNGIFCDGDKQFQNGIQGTNSVDAGFTTGVSVGRILDDGTIDTGQTNYTHSTDLVSISSGNFQDFAEIAKYRKFSLTGPGFAGWGGLTFREYDIAIYDDNDNFVVMLNDVGFYEEVPINAENWKQARVMFKDVVDIAEIDVRLRCDFNSRGLKLESVNVSFCGQNGASNATSGFIWDGGNIHDNGSDEFLGVTTESGYGLDFEDDRAAAQDIKLKNLSLWDNNKGDIAFIGTESIMVEGCTFKKSRRPNWAGSLGINGSFARNLHIRNCDFDNKGITIARSGIISDVKILNGSISASGLGCRISNIEMVQGKITINGTNSVGHNKQGVNTIIENVSIRQYKEFDYILSDRNVLGQFSNIRITLNDASTISNLVDGTSLSASLGTGQEVWEDLDAVGGMPYGGGSIDGFYLQGHTLNNIKTESSVFCSFPQYEWTNNIKTDCGIEIGKNGIGTNDILWENLECTFLRINPDNGDFDEAVPADPVANPAPIFTFRNAKIHMKTGYNDMTNINFRQLKIYPFWVDVVFEGGELVNDVVYAQTLNRSIFFEADNYGKVTFKKTIIGNAGSEGSSTGNDLDFTNDWFRATSRTYPIEIINPTLKHGTSVIRGSRDYVAFTEANGLMATYATFANEAAAVSGDYPTGFFYMTSTGEIRIKL